MALGKDERITSNLQQKPHNVIDSESEISIFSFEFSSYGNLLDRKNMQSQCDLLNFDWLISFSPPSERIRIRR